MLRLELDMGAPGVLAGSVDSEGSADVGGCACMSLSPAPVVFPVMLPVMLSGMVEVALAGGWGAA
jgi:hypothetical protein